MKFGIGVILILGLLIGGSLAVYGIKNNEAGFWMWVGFVIIGVVLLGYYMKKLRDNPPSQRPVLVPFFLLQDTLILSDSAGLQSKGVDWGAAILLVVLSVLFIGGIYILKRKKPTATEMDYPPPDEQRDHPRRSA